MSKLTRNISMAALLALSLSAGGLMAYTGIARHAESGRWGEQGGAVLAAGQIVARNLSALAMERAQEAVAAIALQAARGLSHVYRVALRATGVATVQAARAGGDTGNGAPVATVLAGGETGNGQVPECEMRAGCEARSSVEVAVSSGRAGGVTRIQAAPRVIETSNPGSKIGARDCQASPLCPSRSARRKA